MWKRLPLQIPSPREIGRPSSVLHGEWLNALCSAERQGRAVGTPLVLVAVADPVRRVLELTSLWDHFEHRDNAAEPGQS